MDLGNDGTIRTVGNGCRRNGRNLKEVRHLRKRNHVITQGRELHIANQLEQAALMINQKQDCVARVNHPFVRVSHEYLSLLSIR